MKTKNIHLQFSFSVILILVLSSFQILKPDKFPEAKQTNIGFTNFHQITRNLYRSEQPTHDEMNTLQKAGIQTIINLRQFQPDKRLAENDGFVFVHYRINTWFISEKNVKEVLKIIKDAEKPVLIHCKHGSDRTGCIIAAYRLVFQNWSKKEAIQELREEKYGYNEKYFPNIIDLLDALDIAAIKKELEIP